MQNRIITQEDTANAKRLLKLWNSKKGKLGLTQISAGEKLGFNQSMVSQLLHAKVALSTDHVLKWAQLLGVSPGEINPALSSLGFTKATLRQIKVPVVARMSGEPVGAFEAVEISTRMTKQVYGISVDDESLGVYAKKGSTLIVSQEEEPVSGDEVFIRYRVQDHYLLTVKVYVTSDLARGVAVLKDIITGAQEELQLEQIEAMDPIVSVDRPIVNRPVRLRARQTAN